MTVTYIIKFNVVPDQRGRFLELIGGVIANMRSETTFHFAELHQDPASPNRFMLYETWESHEDVLEVQLARQYREEWHRSLPELLVEDREIEIWGPRPR